MSVTGILVGDLAVRRVPLTVAAANAGLIGFGAAVVGVVCDLIGGRYGAQALRPESVLPLAFAVIVLPLIPNAFFYLQLYLSEAVAFVDRRVTLRWEAVVSVLDIALALGWLGAVTAEATPPVFLGRGAGGRSPLAPWLAAPGTTPICSSRAGRRSSSRSSRASTSRERGVCGILSASASQLTAATKFVRGADTA